MSAFQGLKCTTVNGNVIRTRAMSIKTRCPHWKGFRGSTVICYPWGNTWSLTFDLCRLGLQHFLKSQEPMLQHSLSPSSVSWHWSGSRYQTGSCVRSRCPFQCTPGGSTCGRWRGWNGRFLCPHNLSWYVWAWLGSRAMHNLVKPLVSSWLGPSHFWGTCLLCDR